MSTETTTKQLGFINDVMDRAKAYSLEIEVIKSAMEEAYNLGRNEMSARIQSTPEQITSQAMYNALNEWDL